MKIFITFMALVMSCLISQTAASADTKKESPTSVAEQDALSGKLLVHIEGMACPFCAFGVEKQLKRVPGVKKAMANLGEGTATLTLKPGMQVDPERIRKAVKKAGFKVSEIKNIEELRPSGKRLKLTGRIEETEGKFFLVIKDGTRYSLYDLNRSEESGEALSSWMKRRLNEFSKEKSHIEVEGLVHGHAGLKKSLWIEKLGVHP